MLTDSAVQLRRFWRRLFWAVAVFVLLGLIGATVGYFYLSTDEAPLDDTALLAPIPVTPDAQNGFLMADKAMGDRLDFEAFAKSHGFDPLKIRDELDHGSVTDDANLAAFFATEEPDFVKFDGYLSQPDFAWPGSFSLAEGYAPQVNTCINIIDDWAMAAQLEVQQQNWAAALRDLTRLRKLAMRLAEGHPTGVIFLTVTAAEAKATLNGELMLNQPALPAEALAQLTALYKTEINWPAAAHQVVLQGYREFLGGWQLMNQDPKYTRSAGWPPRSIWRRFVRRYEVQPNATRNQAIKYYLPLLQMLDGPYTGVAARYRTYDAQFLDVHKTKSYLKPNLGGRALLAVVISPATTYIDSVYRQTADDRLLQIGIALRRNANDHGGILPSKLSDLVPQYLGKIPFDPYDYQPLRYDAARETIYSVGTSPDNSSPIKPTLELTFQKTATAPADSAARN